MIISLDPKVPRLLDHEISGAIDSDIATTRLVSADSRGALLPTAMPISLTLTPNERSLADALGRQEAKLIIILRSASGIVRARYLHHGERRRIRHNPRRPIEILGGGFVVAQ